MSQRKYTHIKVLEPEIVEMKESGKTKREIAEHFGLTMEQVKELLKRYRRRERKIAAGIQPRPKGRPRKDAAPRSIEAEQAYEINRLKMENKLLRDFLQYAGGSEAAGQISHHLHESGEIFHIRNVPVLRSITKRIL